MMDLAKYAEPAPQPAATLHKPFQPAPSMSSLNIDGRAMPYRNLGGTGLMVRHLEAHFYRAKEHARAACAAALRCSVSHPRCSGFTPRCAASVSVLHDTAHPSASHQLPGPPPHPLLPCRSRR